MRADPLTKGLPFVGAEFSQGCCPCVPAQPSPWQQALSIRPPPGQLLLQPHNPAGKRDRCCKLTSFLLQYFMHGPVAQACNKPIPGKANILSRSNAGFTLSFDVPCQVL